jgi:Pyruvate/2-oxoglutarate dehydrogenase complex, dihydrolipoamide acyltransferase (E2) component, and related enzymes
MGEGITDATITRWLVSVGDQVDEDTPIVEIATDKVDSEIPAPLAGRIAAIEFKEGDVAQVGQVIAIMEVEGKDTHASHQPEIDKIANKIPGVEQIKQATSAETPGADFSNIYLSPLVKSIIKQENISKEEMETLKGTGLGGRITKEDMLQFLSNRKPQNVTETMTSPIASKEMTSHHAPSQKGEQNGGENEFEIVPMDRMRKLIAGHMVMSKQTSPHVTSFIDVDLTNIVKWRDKNKVDFQRKEGQKLTYTPIFFEAIAKAIKEFPGINASVDGDNVLIKKRINIGMATALPSGNLIVPVIKNAERLNITGLAIAINDLAERARTNKLLPDEIQGGTFTVTNLGAFDTLAGTPIINQPQVAILAIGAIKKVPVVIEAAEGDSIGIRSVAILSLAYDHRVVDGALGGMFLKRIKNLLEQFDPNRVL